MFADKVLKFTQSGKMKRRILVITDFALYLVDPDADILKRRIALAAVDKLCISNLSDNLFAIIVPTEYDCLMASTRKKEIVNVIVKAIKSTSEYEPEVASSNRYIVSDEPLICPSNSSIIWSEQLLLSFHNHPVSWENFKPFKILYVSLIDDRLLFFSCQHDTYCLSKKQLMYAGKMCEMGTSIKIEDKNYNVPIRLQ